MNKILKRTLYGLVGILVIAGIAGGTAYHIHTHYVSHNMNGSYVLSEKGLVPPKIAKHHNLKSRLPKILLHVHHNHLYTQTIIPHRKKLLKFHKKQLKMYAKFTLSKVPANKQKQMKLIMTQREQKLNEMYKKQMTNSYQEINIKHVKKLDHNHINRLHGSITLHTVQMGKNSQITPISRTKKFSSLTIIKKHHHFTIGRNKSMARLYHQIKNKRAIHELKHNHINPKQIDY